MNEQNELSVLEVMAAVQWSHWLSAIFLLLAGLVLASVCARWVDRVMEKRASRHRAVMLRRLVFYVIFVLFAVASMREVGFSMDVVLGAAGIFTVAIGFASQTSASNMVSGLFLLVETPFRIGEYIEVEGTVGEVISIDMLSVKLRTSDNLYVRIPNETLIKKLVVNRSRFPTRRMDLKVGIAYAEDVERVERMLLQLADDMPKCLKKPGPYVLATGFGPSSVDLQFSFWVAKGDVRTGRSEMMIAVKGMLDREGVEIPFPHTSIYAGTHSKPFRIELANGPSIQKEEENNADVKDGGHYRGSQG